MSVRVILAALLSALLFMTAACANDGNDRTTSDGTNTSQDAEGSNDSGELDTDEMELPDDVADLSGDWTDPSVDWVVHLYDDGRFVEDFEGNVDFRSGTWTVTDNTLSLHGGDGYDNEGQIVGDTIVFRLGTLVRAED